MVIVSRLMTVLLFVPLFWGLRLKKKEKLNSEITCYLILFTGWILRLIYIIYTGIDERQHDVHKFFENDAGHAEYIEYLMNNHSLPDFDPREIFQFYHPPLHHIICAVWLTLVRKLGIPLMPNGVESLQFLTAVYSSLFTVFAYKSLKLLGMKRDSLIYSTAFVTFHPTLIILSGSINNDMLSSLFGMTAIYFTIRWSRKRDWLSIVMTAFSIGLGMFTKLAVGLLAPAVAAVFLCVFIRNIKEFKKLIPQFVIFGIICVPIGLFWSVRNYLKFDMPLNYVPRISEKSKQYIDVPFAKRLTDWSLHQFSSPFTQWKWNGDDYNESNPVIALLKNAMFDEETFFPKSITLQSFCTLLFFTSMVRAAAAVISFVFMWYKNSKVKIEDKLFITFIILVIFGNYIIFCKNYPHVCTENMRYCIPLIFACAAINGFYIDREPMRKEKKLHAAVVSLIGKSTVVFCVLSAFVYTAKMFSEIALDIG